MSSRAPILCLGGAAIDRKFALLAPARPATSNPARASSAFGGVARNVAETLARLGDRVALVSAVGGDADGHAILAHLEALGVDVSGVAVVPGETTAQYVAALDPFGDLALGLMDMGVLERAYPRVLARLVDGPALDGLVFADCNAPADGLAALLAFARRTGARLCLDAISEPKARRLPPDLSGLHCLFLNRDEAAAVLGAPVGDPLAAAEALLARGAARVVLTLGPEGAIALDADGARAAIPAVATSVVDVTGAGDALIAGTLHALARGADLAEAARFGTALAARTIARPESVDPTLSPALAATLAVSPRKD